MRPARTYRYQRLNSRNHEIRLLLLEPSADFQAPIECKLQHVYLTNRPEYEALSYTWGDPLVTEEVLLHGSRFPVTTNLESALRHLRYERQGRVLWVDAVCINQKDNSEKAEQVAFMGQVYKLASLDLLWMGSNWSRHKEASHILDYKFSSDPRISKVQFEEVTENNTRSIWDHLVSIFQSPVLGRMWIVQELILAPRIRVVFGHKEFDWSSLNVVASFMVGPRYVNGLSNVHLKGMFQVSSISQARDSQDDVLGVWSEFGFSGCGDPRDKIYAILNVVKDNLEIKPNYDEAPDALFSKVTRRYIARHGNLNALAWRFNYESDPEGPQNISFLPPYTLPSWTPDYGLYRHPYTPRCFKYAYNNDYHTGPLLPWTAASSSLLQCNDPSSAMLLSLIGISLDVITYVSPVTRGWEHEDICNHYGNLSQQLKSANWAEARYFNGENLLEVYWITLSSGMAREGDDIFKYRRIHASTEGPTTKSTIPAVPRRQKPKTKTWRRLFGSYRTCTVDTELQPVQLQDNPLGLNGGRHFYDHLRENVYGNVLATTKDGYMALVPDMAQPGDILCALNGAILPFVLRPIRRGRNEAEFWQLVGPAYMHAFMDNLSYQWKESGMRRERSYVLI